MKSGISCLDVFALYHLVLVYILVDGIEISLGSMPATTQIHTSITYSTNDKSGYYMIFCYHLLKK